ncbi:phosphoglycerate dehydrogenase [Fructilactobacillus fructivorans]|uniref:3-phosphoglycerate dehydrogenase n=1 Tax=Fructilactobacillus fructivorans TaxID=1614 RepID=A0A0C1M7D3_9LACO|nr:phosphoglycerate dehydrogenase [Fructilactobacillus fructivorans]KID42319.1 D-3-phosphoglycerate dehydrogenase [Fructilactobacillus fructivorans]KRK58188.1 D-3-phosphoglycerate dehydrogenase [Fructilactobacillus fructivorans]KRN40937.1 D-3-phosphoglycerate dehydrogenase [Fructilactobacillus fructivorans]KRN42593.1 D-3-phosphoglycerate dehydrogenase [Fructilactobacillus fructivorans]MCT0151062.1 3-phosphoglycerate dehydrogenase [Fructilactobacillus fructivorans]
MAKKVAVQASLAPDGKQLLKDNGFEVVELPDKKISTLLDKAADAYGILIGTAPFPNDTIEKMPNLKIIARNGVGYDNIDVPFMVQHGIYVTITPLANASTVAETTLAEIFDISKNVTNDSHEMREGNWNYKKDHKGFDLEGKTLGILGYGRIGKMVAKKVSGLGMNVIYNSPHAEDSEYGKAVNRDAIFTDSDIVTLHMPVLPSTKGSVGKREFEMMHSSSVLINLARGALINTDDLIDALKSGEIKAAALDVFDKEPLPMDSPLYQLDNVLLTPHIASNTVECMNRMAHDAASEIVKVLNGEQPQWAVQK